MYPHISVAMLQLHTTLHIVPYICSCSFQNFGSTFQLWDAAGGKITKLTPQKEHNSHSILCLFGYTVCFTEED